MRSRYVAPKSPRSPLQSSPAKAALLIAVIAGLAFGWGHFHKLSSNAIATVLHGTPSSAAVPFTGPSEDCDVLVVGGTPSGIAAALSAARHGAKVTLVEPRRYLGGDIVYAMLNMFDVPVRPGVPSPVHGIFAEFFEQLGITFDIDKSRHLFEDTVRAEPNLQALMRTKVMRIIKEEDRVTGVIVKTFPDTGDIPPPAHTVTAPPGTATAHAATVKPVANDGGAKPAVSGTALDAGEGNERLIHVKVVVDATNDASFAAKAGAGYFIGRETANPDKKMQAAGQLFSVSGVDWQKVRDYVGQNRLIRAKVLPNGHLFPGDAVPLKPIKLPTKTFGDADLSTKPALAQSVKAHPASAVKSQRAQQKADVTVKKIDMSKLPTVPAWEHLGGMHGNYAWERGVIVKKYQPHGPDIELLSINFGRQTDGTVVLNTLNILNVNGLDPASILKARKEARAELPYLLDYLRKVVPGFEHAKLAKVAPELYIRETRHIHGFYTLKVDDVRHQERFFDRVAMVSYPLDLHPYIKGQLNPYEPRRYYYTLPLRALTPLHVDNVFIASRSLSATYSAAGSARVIPVTMAAGQATGVAAWMCVSEGITPHQVMKNSKWVHELQAFLREDGADIGDKYPPTKVARRP